jgi:hypothetical protein
MTAFLDFFIAGNGAQVYRFHLARSNVRAVYVIEN